MTEIKNIHARWEKLLHHRREFLDYAQHAAELTLPYLKPNGTRIERRPATQLGAQAARSLSSAVLAITFPPEVKWLRMGLQPLAKQALDPNAVDRRTGLPVVQVMDQALGGVEDLVLRLLASLSARSKMSSLLLRHGVEGNNAVRVDRDRITVYPFRSFVTFRQGGDELHTIIREEEIENAAEATTQVVSGRDDVLKSTRGGWLYTMVDREAGEVWQQRVSMKGKVESPFQVDMDPDQIFVVTSRIPDSDDYATSYVYDHLSVISELEHNTDRLSEATAAAAWGFPIIRPSADITENQLAEHPAGVPMTADPEDLSWYTSDVKIRDWAFVDQYRQSLREELDALFAMRIADRAGGSKTATEVLQIASELNQETQDLLAAVEETLQKPLVRACLAVLGLKDQLTLPGIGSAIDVVITTGQSALQRETAFARLVNTTSVVRSSHDPTLQVNGMMMMDMAGRAQQFDIPDGLFTRGEPAAPEQLGGQQVNEGAAA